MTYEEYLARSAAIENQARERIDLLSAVTKRAPARGGESGAIADAVAGLARREQHRAEIEQIEADACYAQECLEAVFYGLPKPERAE